MLVTSGRALDRGRELAGDARPLYTEAGPRFRDELTAVEAWLAPLNSTPWRAPAPAVVQGSGYCVAPG